MLAIPANLKPHLGPWQQEPLASLSLVVKKASILASSRLKDCVLTSQAVSTGFSCREDLRLAEDGKKCVDIDECAEGTAHCGQQCVNKDPRRSGVPFSCACNLGFSLDPEDLSSCIKTVNS